MNGVAFCDKKKELSSREKTLRNLNCEVKEALLRKAALCVTPVILEKGRGKVQKGRKVSGCQKEAVLSQICGHLGGEMILCDTVIVVYNAMHLSNPTKVFSMNFNVCKFLKYPLAG